MRKPKMTEEFLWKLFEFVETTADVHDNWFGRGSLGNIYGDELRRLRHVYERKQHAKSFSQFLSSLKERGYIKIPSGRSVWEIELTPKGVEKALRGRAREKALQPRKDGKMLMLMFDIPKEKEEVRKAFRNTLQLLDYQMLQKSVWVSDKDVVGETERAIREYDLHPCVHMFVIEKIRVRK